MNSLIVGGDFGSPKLSSIIEKLSAAMPNSQKVNSGTLSDLETVLNNLNMFDLIIWAPNINNEVEKNYPKKTNGSVLICSKVLRPDRDFGDAIARIFKMNANAVIAIDKTEKDFKFILIDALGNVWCSTTNIAELARKIEELYNWTKASIRVNSQNIVFNDNELIKTNLSSLCEIVKEVADKVEDERGGRYFGNVSTRCEKTFPSYRHKHDIVLMSGRNVGKKRISEDDFVYTKLVDGKVLYHGDKKPSVDTPIQLNMYEHFKKINYLIHGHAYIDNAVFTKHYYPCGDLRELSAVKELVGEGSHMMAFNLLNHGFVIGADNIASLKGLVSIIKFKYRQVGIEICNITQTELI